MTDQTIDPMTAPAAELAQALRDGSQGLHVFVRAAVHLVVAACDGDLVDQVAVRRALRRTWAGDRPDRRAALFVQWVLLRDELADGSPDSATAEVVLRLACALADDEPMPNLGRDLVKLDQANRRVVAEAFAVAAGLDPASLSPAGPA